MLAFSEGCERYGADADLDIRFSRASFAGTVSYQAAAGLLGNGAIRSHGRGRVQYTFPTSLQLTLGSAGWAHMAAWIKVSALNGSTTSPFFCFGTDVVALPDSSHDVGNQPGMRIGSDGSVSATMHGDGSVLASSAAGVIIPGETQHLEIAANYKTSGGAVKIWVDGILVVNFAGATNTGTAPATCVGFQLGGAGAGSGSMLEADIDWDDIIVWDQAGTDFVKTQLDEPHEIETKTYDGDDTVAFTKSGGATNFSNVHETGFHDGDATYVDSVIAGDEDLMTVADQATTPDKTFAIAIHTRSKKTAAGTCTLKNKIKMSSTTAYGTEWAQTTGYLQYSDYFGKNPATAAAWGTSDFNSLKAGYKHNA